MSVLSCLLRLQRRVTRHGNKIDAKLSPAVKSLLGTTLTHNPFAPAPSAGGSPLSGSVDHPPLPVLWEPRRR